MRQRYLDFVKKQIIGNDLLFETPYGLRNMFYADYTASGRGLRFIEEKLLQIQKSYANTHTEDDYSGKYLTGFFHQAETRIKRMVNAGEHGKIFSVGSGSTGALKKLQEIIGVYIPPLTKERLYQSCSEVGEAGGDIKELSRAGCASTSTTPLTEVTSISWRRRSTSPRGRGVSS
jgi:hypothetical protein